MERLSSKTGQTDDDKPRGVVPDHGKVTFDVLSAVNDGDSLLRQQLALLITSVDSCC